MRGQKTDIFVIFVPLDFLSALVTDSFLFVPAVIETMQRVVAEIDRPPDSGGRREFTRGGISG
jgi:hypothetical protein